MSLKVYRSCYCIWFLKKYTTHWPNNTFG